PQAGGQAMNNTKPKVVQSQRKLFPLGQIVASPGALEVLEASHQSPAEFLTRHARGDWGDLSADDIVENEFSLKNGFRLLSSYLTTSGEKLWVITEADRTLTTVLLPDEY
ncbi:MAG TPA: hypothetical protein VM711_01015, partial [Sphingomicrobium sp.]|nr:hypothetical protein [Sphingomicrobium sp.]